MAYAEEELEQSNVSGPVTIDRMGWLDWIIFLAIVIVSGTLIFAWAFPGIYPDAAADVAIAAGLRPAADIAPGLWHFIASKIFSFTSIAGGVKALKILGPLAIALCGGLVYFLFREILALAARLRLQFTARWYLIVRLAAAMGAIFFVCSDPVWRAAQIFAPVTLLVLLSVLGVYLFFAFLQGGRLLQAYFAMLVLGVVSAETPMGLVLMAICWGGHWVAVRRGAYYKSPLLNPFVEQISKWHMTFLFALGLLAAIAINCFTFNSLAGMAAGGLENGDLPVVYGVRLWHLATSAASPLGWVLALGIIILPCAVSAGLLPRAVDEEQFLPYYIGVLFFATGLVAYAQLAALDPLWMWTWVQRPTLFRSQYLLCLLMLGAAATVAFSLVVLGVDTFCRDYRRLAMQMFPEMNLEGSRHQLLMSRRFLGTLRQIGLMTLPVLLIAGVVPGRSLKVPRQMAALLEDYVHEVIAECGQAQWIFTDGAFDAKLELAAAMAGKKLRAMSMMASSSPRDVYIRSQGALDEEDALTMKSGAAAVLRTWIKDKPERLAKVAMQLGMEIWKRDGLTPPPSSGVVLRPSGMTEEERVAGVTRATALAKRILAMYAAGGTAKVAGAEINRLFLFMQWRLSRMMRVRAELADQQGRTGEAVAEVKLADELDNHSAAIHEIRENMERMRQLALRQMTPREGLQFALVRADFNLARKYAEPILDAVPDDPNANFGMGMSFFVEKQWARAEEYLRRCLVRNPKEPAVYNNLAIVQLNTGRLAAALRNANKALELVPESAEVKDTIKQIKKAQAAALKKASSIK